MNERIALYSSSLYCVAVEGGCTKEVYESIIGVRDILAKNADYAKIISAASIEYDVREKLLDEAFSGRVHPFVLNFMKILARKRIFEILSDVAEEFKKSYFKDNNIERTKITTAICLSDEKKKAVTDRIAKATGKEIIPEFVVDEKILGGIIIETENSNVDASLTGKLDTIKRYISKN